MTLPGVKFLRRFAKPAPTPAPVQHPPGQMKGRFDLTETPNGLWRAAERGYRITVPPRPLLRGTSRIFTIGSCFAMEIRHALERRGMDVYPKYRKIEFDGDNQRLGSMPKHDDIAHYDTFTIRQEFEQAFAGQHYTMADFLQHKHKLSNHFSDGGRTSWQDPYRKKIYAANEDHILDLSRKIDACIADGVHNSDIYVITLGLIETWRNNRNGLHICVPPYDESRQSMKRYGDLEFHLSSFAENYENVKRICTLVAQHYPHRKIVLTVSPVGLGRTYSDNDIVTANVESKSLLRTVAGQICREFPFVHYWPSYELCMREDIYRPDGRHVRHDVVDMIVETFIKAYAADAPAAPTAAPAAAVAS